LKNGFVLPELFRDLKGRALLEAQVLGSIFWNPDALGAVDLSAYDFSHPIFRQVFSSMQELSDEGMPVNESTVTTMTGNASIVCELPFRVTPTGENLLFYLQRLKKMVATEHRKRVVDKMRAEVSRGEDAAAAAVAMNNDLKALEIIYGDHRADDKSLLSEAMREVVRRFRDRDEGPPKTLTGIGWLDGIAKGFDKGDYICLAARPSVGKTALALQIMASMAARGHKLMFFSLEMPPEALAPRILSAITLENVSIAARNPAQAEENVRLQVLAARERAMEIARNIWVVQKKQIRSPECLSAKIKQAKEDGCSLVVCDYANLVPHPSKDISAKDRIDAVSKSWKWGLSDHGLPGILLAQIGRAVDREKRPPTCSDLKDCGSLEEDADYVWLLHRPINKSGRRTGSVDFYQAKGRNVGEGFAPLEFNGDHQRFGEREKGKA
jgi:replicative DNA helicase